MTWEFRSTISDRIHHLVGSDGSGVWGIASDGSDADAPGTLGSAEVDLPIGRRRLLLVPACPGGLVLDVMRAYQGLSEAELATLFLGIVDALNSSPRPEERLTLAAFALDAAGRPVLIPGITTALDTSPRRAVGEMLYHAGHGSPWTECLLPINLALAEASPALRSLVGDLLADSPADPSLSSALAEVAAAMRDLARPVPLPLVPADRELSPETALTARLRAVPDPSASSDRDHAAAAGVRDSTVEPQPSSTETGTRATEALRSASRRPRRSRHRRSRRQDLRSLRASWVRERLAALREHAGPAFRFRWLVATALCLALFGGALVWNSRPSADAAGDGQAGPAESTEAGPVKAAEAKPSAEDVAQVLDRLSADRARALSDGDAKALRGLTVPGSAAAAADELIDQSAFAGSDYAIEVDDVKVLSADADRLVASARMHSRAGSGSTSEDFGTVTVEFALRRLDDGWRVEQVTEVDSETEPAHP